MFDIIDYLKLITTEHADKPKFVQTIAAFVRPFIDAQNLFKDLAATFDLDTAIGLQLDAVGQWVGRTRLVNVPLAGIYFSFNTAGVGFDQGSWKGPLDPETGVTSLPDDVYRLLLRAKIVLNHWDGSIAMAASAIDLLFQDFPQTIITIQDNQDMSMIVGISGTIPPAVLVSLLQGGYLPLNPATVLVNYATTSFNTAALFGFDASNSAVSGFDIGAWNGQIGDLPGTVIGFGVSSVGQTSVNFTWLPPSVGTGPFSYQGQYRLSAPGSVYIMAGPKVSTTNLTFSGLSPDTEYAFRVYAINGAGLGLPTSPVVVRTLVGPPAKVTGLVSTSTTDTSITLAWNAVSGSVITYQPSYKLHTSSTWLNFGAPIADPRVTVTGLTPNTVYDFRVISQNSVSGGDPSDTLVAGTSGSNPGVVQSFQAGTTTTTSVNLLWLPPVTNNGPYTYGLLTAINVNPITYVTTPSITTELNGQFVSYTVTGLTSGGSYLFEVYASNIVGNGPPCAPLTVQLTTPAPDQITGVAVGLITQSSIYLSWNSSSLAATYQPQYQKSGATQWTSFGSPISTNSTTITGLAIGTTYNLQVYGINSQSVAGPPSVVVSATTAGSVPSSPTNFSVANVTTSTADLAWGLPVSGSTPIVYQPQYKLTNSSVWNNFRTPISGLSVTVTGLQSNSSYDFMVVATNAIGVGGTTNVISATTTISSSTTVWDAAQSTSGVTISNSNRSASSASGAGNYGAKSNIVYSAGKRFVEFAIITSTVKASVGFASLPFSFTISGQDTKLLIGNGTGSITDTTGVVWKLVDGTPTRNGNTVSGAVGVQKLVFTLGQIWYQGANNLWLYWDFATSGWLPSSGQSSAPSMPASVDGTSISLGQGYGFVDSSGNIWNLVSSSSGQVVRNGTIDATTSSISQLAYLGTRVYKLSGSTWTIWNASASVWDSTTAPVLPTTLNPPRGLGTDNLSIGVYPCNATQSVRVGNLQLVSGSSTSASGDVVSIAFDIDSKLLWFADNAMRLAIGPSAWNNNIQADPATGVGGINVSGLANGLTFELGFSDASGGASVNINTGNAAFNVSLPHGFSAWDGTGVGAVDVPTAPTGMSTPAKTASSVTLSWTASANSPTNYQIMFRSTGSTSNWCNGALVSGTATTGTVGGLLASFSYDFYVYGINSGGSGPSSPIVTESTLAPGVNPFLAYRGMNLAGADLSIVASTKTTFPSCNSVVIPIWCSTANQTSNDVTLTVTLSAAAAWIDAAIGAGMSVFLSVYMSVRDGTSSKTITPSDVPTFFVNLQNVCVQIAQLGKDHLADGMWCGSSLQPWSGTAAGDGGPFTPAHLGQWESVYNACKSVWNSGIISYAASQAALGLASPTSPTSMVWNFWDAVVFNIYPGSPNTDTTAATFENFWDTTVDPNPSTQAATGNIPLFLAIDNYSRAIGQPVIINSCGIVPCDGNQASPNNVSPVPPPYDYTMQSEWWNSIFYEVNKYLRSFWGFFCSDGGSNTYNSPYNGINYYGLSGTAAGTTVNANFSNLLGTVVVLQAPGNFAVTSVSTTSITTTWDPVSGTGIVYVPQIAPHGTSSWTSLTATSSTTATYTGLLSLTAYDVRVFAQQGSFNGPYSAVLSATTSQIVGVGITASRSRDFTSTCGVQTRTENKFGSNGSASPYYNDATTLSGLDYLNPKGRGTGVAIIRESVPGGSDVSLYNTWGSYGYKYCFIFGVANPATVRTSINSFIASGYVAWIEGPSEVDIAGPISPAQNYTSPADGVLYSGVNALAHCQIDAWNFFHTGAKIAKYSLSSTTTGYGVNNNTIQQAITAAGYSLNQVCTAGNVHDTTTRGYCPTDRVAKIDNPNSNWMIENVGALQTGDTDALGMPRASTRSAVTNFTLSGNNYYGNSYVAGCYCPQLYLHAYLFGYKLMCLTELFDQAPNNGVVTTHYGLWDVNAHPFGAAVSIRNLMQIVGDSGANAATFTPGSLNYSVSGLPSTADQLLLQLSNTDFVLIFWPNATIYNKGVYTAAPVVTIAVAFGAVYPNVTVYDILQNTQNTNIIGNANWLANTLPITPSQGPISTANVSVTMGDGPVAIVISSVTGGSLATPQNLEPNVAADTSVTLSWAPVTE